MHLTNEVSCQTLALLHLNYGYCSRKKDASSLPFKAEITNVPEDIRSTNLRTGGILRTQRGRENLYFPVTHYSLLNVISSGRG